MFIYFYILTALDKYPRFPINIYIMMYIRLIHLIHLIQIICRDLGSWETFLMRLLVINCAVQQYRKYRVMQTQIQRDWNFMKFMKFTSFVSF